MLSTLYCSDISTIHTDLLFSMGLDTLRSSLVCSMYLLYVHVHEQICLQILSISAVDTTVFFLLLITLLGTEIRVNLVKNGTRSEWDEMIFILYETRLMEIKSKSCRTFSNA